MSVPLLSPDQEQIAQMIAARVIELIDERDHRPAPRVVTAEELAKLFSISRATVYENADELGAVRMGEGRNARIRFDPERASKAWTARSASRQSTSETPPALGTPRRRRRTAARSDVDLLPVRGESVG